jgi:hypothetical protein
VSPWIDDLDVLVEVGAASSQSRLFGVPQINCRATLARQ